MNESIIGSCTNKFSQQSVNIQKIGDREKTEWVSLKLENFGKKKTFYLPF